MSELETLRSGCEEGSIDACWEMHLAAPDGSDDEEFGATCGGRTDGDRPACAHSAAVPGENVEPDSACNTTHIMTPSRIWARASNAWRRLMSSRRYPTEALVSTNCWLYRDASQ